MRRGKQIMYTAHCVLNQNAVIREWERAQGAFNDIVRVLLDNHISIIQLPCPEFTFLGEKRPPKTKEEYDIPVYRRICNELAQRVINQMKEYIGNGYEIVGLLGIKGSPSCDTLGEKGIFMEELLKLMNKEKIHLDCFDIPEEYVEGRSDEILEDFRTYVKKNSESASKKALKRDFIKTLAEAK